MAKILLVALLIVCILLVTTSQGTDDYHPDRQKDFSHCSASCGKSCANPAKCSCDYCNDNEDCLVPCEEKCFNDCLSRCLAKCT
ncbi:hypothetical protein CASFOL_008496 [Castilleja foliolosa]|uniref:Uncharacterized protein n=1 Tax=Castilleja foliolosa TaxID=1961234 RepID=A0ABD3DZ47_9LAMI